MVAVHGMEYSFGAHDYPTSGVFEVEPRTCPGYTFRKSICIGRTDLNPRELREFMEKLAGDYNGSTYNLIGKNCNHFCNDVCVRLTGNPIPRWVNRLARIGWFLFNIFFDIFSFLLFTFLNVYKTFGFIVDHFYLINAQ